MSQKTIFWEKTYNDENSESHSLRRKFDSEEETKFRIHSIKHIFKLGSLLELFHLIPYAILQAIPSYLNRKCLLSSFLHVLSRT